MKTNPNFDTNAPPFVVGGCRVVLGGAFYAGGGAIPYPSSGRLIFHVVK